MASATNGTRAVLAEGVTRDRLDDVFVEAGYRLVNVIEPAPGRPAQLVFARDARDYVYVVDDPQLGVSYLAMRAQTEEAKRIADAMPCDSVGTARTNLEGSVAARARGLATLVLLEPDAQDLTEHIAAALGDDDPSLRVAGLTALAYAPRANLRPALIAIREGDPEPTLRVMAARVLASAFAEAS